MSINNAFACAGWMSRGACRRADPELFFPISDSAAHLVAAAKAVCQACSVRALCLAFAVETRQDGIWGGTTSDERHAMRHQAPRRGIAGPIVSSGGPTVSFPSSGARRRELRHDGRRRPLSSDARHNDGHGSRGPLNL
jgi:WhiB family transcriptional regulator, redox-sensing transcriptional regulator